MIHHPSSSLKSLLQNSSAENFHNSTPFSEQESYNNSISDNQCESFQSLIKKGDIDSSTRNTQWSENEKDTASTHQILNDQNHSQNENYEKFISYTTVWKFHEESTQLFEIEENKKKITEKIESIKKCLLESRNEKMQKYKNLLPYFYNVSLPKDLKKMLKTADEIDKHLIGKKNAEYTDNIKNIFNTLFCEEEMSSLWSTIKKLLFICENYYKIRMDPLKNICLSFSNRKDNRLANRKERLRKAVVDFYCAHKDSFELDKVPEILTDPIKTAKFYPENLNIQTKVSEGKLKNEYLEKLKKRVLKRELNALEKNHEIVGVSPYSIEDSSNVNELECFCDLVTEVFAEKKVSHMYKVSLIENLRKKETFTLEKIFSLLKFIQDEGIFLEGLIKSGCQIFKINQKERESLLEIFSIKVNKKEL